MLNLRNIPIALTALRAALGPVILAIAFTRPDTSVFAGCLMTAFISDYFDGVFARRLGVATANLRRMDSIADSIFYVSAFIAAWHLHSELLQPYLMALLFLLAVEVVRYAYDFWKFGKEASYHMWSSKIWGIALFCAFFAILVYGQTGWPVTSAVYIGIAADLEGLAISATLLKWRSDVPTLFHAIKLSRHDASAYLQEVRQRHASSQTSTRA